MIKSDSSSKTKVFAAFLPAVPHGVAAGSVLWLVGLLEYPEIASHWKTASLRMALGSLLIIAPFTLVLLRPRIVGDERRLDAWRGLVWSFSLAMFSGFSALCVCRSLIAGGVMEGRALRFVVAAMGLLTLTAAGLVMRLALRRSGGWHFLRASSACLVVWTFTIPAYLAVCRVWPALQSLRGAVLSLTLLGLLILTTPLVAFRWRSHACFSPLMYGGLSLILGAALLLRITHFTMDRVAAWKLAPNQPRWVILLTIDTLRADEMGFINPASLLTPSLDALAAESVVFRHAYSPGPWTVPSFGSIMTGLDPVTHGAVATDRRLPDNVVTIAELMRESGWRTIALHGNPFLAPEFGFDQGFDEYVHVSEGTSSPEGNPLLEWLARWPHTHATSTQSERLAWDARERARLGRAAPVFLWLHFFDPHGPYDPPLHHFERLRARGQTLRSHSWNRSMRELQPGELPQIRELYRSELLFVDECVGRFMNSLRKLGIYEDSLILFTSDHGEEFMEHGGLDHGHSLHRELMEVPLLVKLPRNSIRGVRESRVSTASVAVTLAELAGLRGGFSEFAAPSLGAMLKSDQAGAPADIFGTGIMEYYPPQDSIIVGDYKLILPRDGTQEPQLFNVRIDTGETRNLVRDKPDFAAALQGELGEHRRARQAEREALGFREEDNKASPSPEQLSTIEKLGYLR